MTNELTVIKDTPLAVFSSERAFESAQRMAKALAQSDLVPVQYKNNVANCLIALEIAQRTGASIMAVTQSLNIIHGRPNWSSQYIIAAINSCGRFSPLRYEFTSEKDNLTCVAWATDSAGERLEGPPVSIAMAKSEGWYDKSGSKWKTMPKNMLMYRAAAFFGRLYAPDILFGMHSEDEVREIIDVTPDPSKSAASSLNEKIRGNKKNPPSENKVVDVVAENVTGEDKEFF